MLSLKESDTGLKANMTTHLTAKYSISDTDSTITVADDTILLLREGDIDTSTIKFAASSTEKAGVAIVGDDSITFYTVGDSAAILSSGKELNIALVGVDIENFAAGNLVITA